MISYLQVYSYIDAAFDHYRCAYFAEITPSRLPIFFYLVTLPWECGPQLCPVEPFRLGLLPSDTCGKTGELCVFLIQSVRFGTPTARLSFDPFGPNAMHKFLIRSKSQRPKFPSEHDSTVNSRGNVLCSFIISLCFHCCFQFVFFFPPLTCLLRVFLVCCNI